MPYCHHRKILHFTMITQTPAKRRSAQAQAKNGKNCRPPLNQSNYTTRALKSQAQNRLTARPARPCRPSAFSAISHIDRRPPQITLSVKSSSFPQNSLSSHRSFLLLKIITLSLSFLMYLANSERSFSSCAGVSSPSKTEFCILHKYFLHVLNTFGNTLFPSPSSSISYTKITYITYHHILNPSYFFSPIKCFISL